MKTPKCTICGGEHYKTFCHKAPRKPIKTASKAVKAKKGKTTRPKAKPRSYYVKQLDSVFSKYIRYSAVEEDGLVTCVTCGDRIPPKDIQNGHFISRGKYPTRWEEDNCHPQCVRDNIFLNGRYIDYTLFMVREYGLHRINELKEQSISGKKISTAEIKDMIELYKDKLANL